MIRLKNILLEKLQVDITPYEIEYSTFSGKVTFKFQNNDPASADYMQKFKYSGEYVMGKDVKGKETPIPAGHGLMINLTNGGSVEGNFYKGSIRSSDPVATFKRSDGSVQYKGQLKNGQYNGKGTYYFRGNPSVKYIGNFVDGFFNGTGTFTSINDIDFNGTWKNDEFIWKDGKTFTVDELNKLTSFLDLDKGAAPEKSNPPKGGSVKQPKGGSVKQPKLDTNWYQYSDSKYTDNNYYYQKRGDEWFAKNVNTNQEFNISVIPKYQKTTVRLNLAVQKKDGAKLTAV